MGQVTALKRAKSRGSIAQVAIELDDEPWLTASESIVAEFLLRKGMEIDTAQQAAIEERAVELGALAYCHQAIARNALSEQRLAERLAGRGFADGIIERTLARCRELGLVDDVRYAERFAEGRSRRGHGRRRIEQDLRRRGISAETARDALDQLAESDDHDPVEACVQLLGRRWRDTDLGDPRERARAQRYLAGRGFSFAEINAAIRAHEAHLRG